MKKRIITFLAALPFIGFSQNELTNKGGAIYTEKGALIHVQGEVVNDQGDIKNDGIIELSGDFENKAGSNFGTHTDGTSKERALKFVGTGPQAIKGELNGGTAALHNVVIDKPAGADTVELRAPVTVTGSLIFGTATTTNTYQPGELYTNNNGKGLLKTYDNTGEYILTLDNGQADAVAGFATLNRNGNPTTGFILTSGTRGSANGGVRRKITEAGAYSFPIGTAENGFNGVKMTFSHIPDGGGYVMGKFNDGSDNPNGVVGSISSQCVNCGDEQAANDGYNQYFNSNPCNGAEGQWLVLEGAVTDHGYWSFGADANEDDYQYVVEAYPNSYTAMGNEMDAWRTLQYKSDYNYNPSTEATDWARDIDQTATPEDLLAYSLNTGDCYTGDGVPGGVYTGFGQFAMMKSNGGGALPVEMIYVSANAKGSAIEVTWATAVEINNSGFEVLRSEDGKTFSNIGWVNGYNNSTVTRTYNYVDNNVTAGVTYYYQLRQIDNDGASEKSEIVAARLNTANVATAELTVSEPMPNPAKDYSRIVVGSTTTQDVLVQIYSMNGQLVANTTATVTAGNSTVTLDVNNLVDGMYTTVIVANGKNYAKNLIVSKN